MSEGKVWFVTGASKGLGLILVKKLLNAGYRVAATSRDAHQLKTAVDVYDTDRFLPLVSDLQNPDCVCNSVEQTVNVFGRIDVVINNAGFGMTSSLEETPDEDIARIVGVNLLAPINVVKSVSPILRRQQSGHIFNIGSVAGLAGASGWSVYSATKSALAALSEVLALDLGAFGIKVTVVMLAGFRTNFLTDHSLKQIPSEIPGYELINETQEKYFAASGTQPGDPEKAADILIKVAESTQPPLHLLLGKDAYDRGMAKLTSMLSELERWKSLTHSADFDL